MILIVPGLGFFLQNNELSSLAPVGIPRFYHVFYHKSDRLLLSDVCTGHTEEESLSLTNMQIAIYCLLNAKRCHRGVSAVILGQFTTFQASTLGLCPDRIHIKQNGTVSTEKTMKRDTL